MSRRTRLATEMYDQLYPKTRKSEMQRRLTQIRRGALKGRYVADEAVYRAHGMVGPEDIRLVTSITDDE